MPAWKEKWFRKHGLRLISEREAREATLAALVLDADSAILEGRLRQAMEIIAEIEDGFAWHPQTSTEVTRLQADIRERQAELDREERESQRKAIKRELKGETRIVRPRWAVGVSNAALERIAAQEGTGSPTRLDWADSIDSTVIAEARRGLYR